MVGRLVENQQVRFCQQHVSQCHTLLLTTTQLSHGLVEVANLQLRQDLLGLQYLLWVSLVVEAGIQHRLRRVELGRLLQHADLQVAAEHDVTGVVALLAGEYRQKRRLACTVLGYQSYLLAFADGETDIAEQLQGAKRLTEVLNVKIWGHSCLLICSI